MPQTPQPVPILRSCFRFDITNPKLSVCIAYAAPSTLSVYPSPTCLYPARRRLLLRQPEHKKFSRHWVSPPRALPADQPTLNTDAHCPSPLIVSSTAKDDPAGLE